LRDNLWVVQMGLFTRAEITTMRDRTRRRNYSAEAEELRRERARHREWGLTQRHARKLSRLYGSTANAAAAFQRRADELTSPSCPSCSARAVTPTSSEPVGAEPPASASASALPEPIGRNAITSEWAEPERAEPEQVVPEQAEPEQVVPEQVVPEQVVPEQAEPECVEPECVVGVAGVSGPSGPGNASRCPDPRFRASRTGKRRPTRRGRHPGPARKGPRRPQLTRQSHPRTGPETPTIQARRPVGATGVKNARKRRITPLSPRPADHHHRYQETAATISHRDIRRGPPNTPPCPADRAHIGHDRMLRR